MNRDQQAESIAQPYSRRALLRAALEAAGAAALAACGSGGAPSTGGGGGNAPTAAVAANPSPTTAARPTAAPTASVATTAAAAMEGRIPSNVPGVPDAWTKLPPPYKATTGVPGKGGKVNVFSILYGAAPAPRAENRFWQELEKRLGVTWEPTLAPNANYNEKAAAVIAGGDLGDLFYLNPSASAPGQYRTLQQGAFLDLTPYLTGDAGKDFPNLTQVEPYNLPYIWKNSSVRGKIYGVPKPVLRSANIPFYRDDWARKIGIAAPKNAEDLYNMLVGFSKRDPDGNGQPDTYGMSQSGGGWQVAWFTPTFRAPNGWRLNPDGSLTNSIETEEHKQAVEFARRLYAGGAYHPDAAGMSSTQVTDAYRGGKTGMHNEGFIAFWGPRGSRERIKENTSNPNASITALVPPGHDGGQGVSYNMNGFWGFTGIPAAVGRNRERVRELLQIMNYLAAPFGSEEHTFLWNGIEGVHHEARPDGTRVNGERAGVDMPGLVYMLQSEYRFYYPGSPGDSEKSQQISKDVIAIGIDNPTFGLNSDTFNTKAAELTQFGNDRVTAVVTGREPMSAWDAYVREWKSRGGDQIRKEYEQELKGQ